MDFIRKKDDEFFGREKSHSNSYQQKVNIAVIGMFQLLNYFIYNIFYIATFNSNYQLLFYYFYFITKNRTYFQYLKYIFILSKYQIIQLSIIYITNLDILCRFLSICWMRIIIFAKKYSFNIAQFKTINFQNLECIKAYF